MLMMLLKLMMPSSCYTLWNQHLINLFFWSRHPYSSVFISNNSKSNRHSWDTRTSGGFFKDIKRLYWFCLTVYYLLRNFVRISCHFFYNQQEKKIMRHFCFDKQELNSADHFVVRKDNLLAWNRWKQPAGVYNKWLCVCVSLASN